MKFAFGQSAHERLEIEILSVESPISDDDWINVAINVSAGAFSGNFKAFIRACELSDFLSQLHTLYDRLSGIAEFSTIEDQISLILKGDGKGHITLLGRLRDQAGDGNQLTINLEFDQSILKQSINSIDAVLKILSL